MEVKAVLIYVERVAVSVAAIAALFPIWQFTNEVADRELDRAANFVLAYRACFGEDGVLAEETRVQELGRRLNEAIADSVEQELTTGQRGENDREIAVALREELDRVSVQMRQSCDRLERIYLAGS